MDAEPKGATQIPYEVERGRELSTGLREVIERLEVRLARVTRVPIEKPQKKPAESSPEKPSESQLVLVAEEMAETNANIDDGILRIVSIIDRLEL